MRRMARKAWLALDGHGIWLLGLAGMCLLVAVRDPTELTWFPQCPTQAFLGLHCPGCGTTRALHALLHGHVRQAFAFNSLAMIALPMLLLIYLRDRRLPHQQQIHRSSRFIIAIFIVVVVYAVARNMPVEPYSLLAPHRLEASS